MLAEFSDKLTAELRGRVDSALRDTREALRKKDAAAAAECTEALRKALKEAGVVIYAQSSEAPKRGAYAETKWPGAESEAGGPRTRVVDAEYHESK